MSEQVVAGQLRSFVERIERLEEEIRELNESKSDIYKEVRSFGYDVKTVRKVVAKRRKDPTAREEEDTLFDMYWNALHNSENCPERSSTSGTPRATRARTISQSDGGAFVAVKAQGRLANADSVEPSPSETVLTNRILRPHCLNPDTCGGYGSKHCHVCLKARDDATEAA